MRIYWGLVAFGFLENFLAALMNVVVKPSVPMESTGNDNHGITEPFQLENTFKIIEAKHVLKSQVFNCSFYFFLSEEIKIKCLS